VIIDGLGWELPGAGDGMKTHPRVNFSTRWFSGVGSTDTCTGWLPLQQEVENLSSEDTLKILYPLAMQVSTMFSGYSSSNKSLHRRIFRSLHINSMQDLDRLGTIDLTPLNPDNRRSQSLCLEGPKLERTHSSREHLVELFESAVFHLRQDECHPDGSNDGERSIHEPNFALEIPIPFVLHVWVDEGDQDADGEAAEGGDGDCLFAELEGRSFCCYDPDADVMLVRIDSCLLQPENSPR
jgi:hypothetical protein